MGIIIDEPGVYTCMYASMHVYSVYMTVTHKH